MKPKVSPLFFKWRFYIILIILIFVMLALIVRMLYLTVLDRGFLQHQGNVRTLRTMNTPADRGMILSRDGAPLAISIPVDSVWVNPQDFPGSDKNLQKIAPLLNLSVPHLEKVLHRNKKRMFVYLKRDVSASTGDQLQALGIPGIYLEKQYHRHYPQGPVASHVIGFTNIDDAGQEGLELAYNGWLQGSPGKRQVLKDRLGHIVAIVGTLLHASAGKNLTLSINNRIQFLAYHVLKQTVSQYHAKVGTVVVLNPNTGEVLAMVNQPDFDPNLPHTRFYSRYRNRAVTDVFEPGSTMKAFSIANAVDSGRYTPDTEVDIGPGWLMIGRNEVHDEYSHGTVTVTQIMKKSSNVGVAKMTLSLSPEHLLSLLHKVGFGEATSSGFPGESSGDFPQKMQWRPFELATLAFGYGISVTPLQLTHAYGVIANKGRLCPVTFLKREDPVHCPQVMNPKTAKIMLDLLQQVVGPGATGRHAVIPGYQVAGKTGTSYIAGPHGYDKTQIISSFVGIAPVSKPQLVIAVIIQQPQGAVHLGGVLAGPAFAKIMAGALRILNIPPDAVEKNKS